MGPVDGVDLRAGGALHPLPRTHGHRPGRGEEPEEARGLEPFPGRVAGLEAPGEAPEQVLGGEDGVVDFSNTGVGGEGGVGGGEGVEGGGKEHGGRKGEERGGEE